MCGAEKKYSAGDRDKHSQKAKHEQKSGKSTRQGCPKAIAVTKILRENNAPFFASLAHKSGLSAIMNDTITIKRFTGKDVEQYISDVARLRIEVFREYPYLYNGDMAYEANYLRTYTASPDSVIVIAFDGNTVVGASTAVPLRHEMEEIKRPFLEMEIDTQSVFYLGESVLRREYRGRGIGVRFFEEREAHARQIDDFVWAAFCAVERPANHPRRPADYAPLDEFWNHRGYFKRPELRTTLSWRDLDESSSTPKPMVFWLKRLA